MEEEKKLKRSNTRLKAIIVILVFTLVLAGILIFVFCCGKKEDAPKVDPGCKDETDCTEPAVMKTLSIYQYETMYGHFYHTTSSKFDKIEESAIKSKNVYTYNCIEDNCTLINDQADGLVDIAIINDAGKVVLYRGKTNSIVKTDIEYKKTNEGINYFYNNIKFNANIAIDYVEDINTNIVDELHNSDLLRVNIFNYEEKYVYAFYYKISDGTLVSGRKYQLNGDLIVFETYDNIN